MTGSSSDETAGRLRAAEKASRAYDQYGNRLPSMTVVANADLAEILDEREQLREANQLAEAQLAEIGAERAEWKARSQRGDTVATILRAGRAVATARAEQAEAKVRVAIADEIDGTAERYERRADEADRSDPAGRLVLVVKAETLRSVADWVRTDGAEQQRQDSEEGTA